MSNPATVFDALIASSPVKDRQKVSRAGQPLGAQIDGVVVDSRPLHEDERGELQEIYNPAWGLNPDPLVFAYLVSVRPGMTRGWVVHRLQDDRLFVAQGTLRFGLFDDRPQSPTFGMLNVFVVSERKRSLIVIPRGVFHALKNIGTGDALFINLPTAPYDHVNPDKYRLPLRNSVIPFAFDDDPSS